MQFAYLSIGIEYSKFQQRSVSNRGTMSLPCEDLARSIVNTFLWLCVRYEANTSQASSSAICAGIYAMVLPSAARTRYYSNAGCAVWHHIAVISRTSSTR